MKVFLMYPDRDFDAQQPLPFNAPALTQDLELNTLFEAMARDDKFLFEVAQKAIFSGFANDVKTIRYRQDILRDCLRNPEVVRDIYQLPIESTQYQRRHWLGIFSHYPSGVLAGALALMEMFVLLLKRLKMIADHHADKFESEGFTRFFEMIKKELDEAYFAEVQAHLETLHFRDGVLLSAELGRGNEGVHYVLREVQDKDRNWMKRLLSGTPVYSFSLHPRDDHGQRVLGELKDQGIDLVANALGQSADHINSFFKVLQTELAFYIGSLNLYEQLLEIDAPTAFPTPLPLEDGRYTFTELYDICLALTMKQRVVGNTADASHKRLVMITGANQGGKSTFLRSVGVAQLMLQCGMFVPAAGMRAPVCRGLFTHYRRKEDATMESGKLDEELSRMSEIADHITADCMILFNESFAATNEREGSEIGRQIVSALLERRVRVFYVTHLYELARGFYAQKLKDALFLRAERQPDGSRTFKLHEGAPLETSFGKDLYQQVFEGDREQERAPEVAAA